MDDLPIARTPEQEFLAAVCHRLDRQNTLLADLRDRLPAPLGGQPEPAASQPPAATQVTEPAVPAAPDNTTLLAEPAAPEPPAALAVPKSAPAARKQPARKPQAKKATTPRTRGRAAAPKGKES